jgi:lipopolysaccharide biosynthesis glycosyltransferase
MIIDKPVIFIGYDSKEDIAYRVCKQSLNRTSNNQLDIRSLKLYELVAKKFYTRGVDPLASTEFTYSRFLIPALMNFKGWAIFCDCDFLFFENILKLFNSLDEKKAIYCVQHD